MSNIKGGFRQTSEKKISPLDLILTLTEINMYFFESRI